MPRDMQPTFTGGEITPRLHSRVDTQRYHTSLATCKNHIIRAHGGLDNRAGFEFICESENSTGITRLVPFSFNTDQNYILVFTSGRMQVIKEGGRVLGAAQSITNVSAANPAAITIVGHGLSDGDLVQFSGTGVSALDDAGLLPINYLTANAFSVPVDGTGWSSGGTVENVVEFTVPYTVDAVGEFNYTQSADVLTTVHEGSDIRDITRTSDSEWTVTAKTIANGVQTPTCSFNAMVGTASGINNKEYRYCVTAVLNGTESAPSSIVTTGSVDGLSETYGAEILAGPGGVTFPDYYNVYKERDFNSGTFGFIGEMTELTGGAALGTFTDYNLGPDMSVTPPQQRDPFSGTNDKPAAVTYHQQRIFYASSRNDPQKIWSSKTGDFDNHDISRPTREDDPIEFTIAAKQVNKIRHLLSLDTLLAFTAGAVWRIDGGGGTILSPSSIDAKIQTGRGASEVPPILVGETALYIQSQGSKVRDLAYSFGDDKYVGNDLTVMAEHLFKGYTIVDWCYQEEPYDTIWAIRSDGVMLSLAYLKEHQVWGWARHETDGEFERCASIQEGNEDALYVVVKRTINGTDKRYIERLKEREDTTIEDAFFVDSGLTYTGETHTITGATAANPVVITATSHGLTTDDVIYIVGVEGMTELNGRQFKVTVLDANSYSLQGLVDGDIDGTAFTAYTSGGTGRKCTNTLSGLDHLEGKSCVALADGNTMSGLLVTSGVVTLPSFAWKIHIGLGYNSDMETLDMDMQGQGMVQTRKKSVSRVTMDVRNTRGLSVGQDENNLYEIKERDVSHGYGSIPSATGEQKVNIATGWTDGGRIFVRQSYPLPCSILAIMPEVEVSG